MSRISLKSLICELTPEEWKKNGEEIAASRVQPPVLTPQQEEEVIQQFKALPSNKKKEYAWCIKHPCGSCEQEFKTANVGSSHGYCKRHLADLYAMMKKPAPTTLKGVGSFDMANWSPEEQKFAEKLYAVAKARHERKKSTPSTPAPTPETSPDSSQSR